MTSLRISLNDSQKVEIALRLQKLRRLEDPSYTVWIEAGQLRERFGFQGGTWAVAWYNAALAVGVIVGGKAPALEALRTVDAASGSPTRKAG